MACGEDTEPGTADLRLLRAAVEASGEAILITSADLNEPGPRIEYANPAFTRMTGYEAGEVIGRSPRFLQGPDTDRAVLDRLRRALEAGEAAQGEAVNYRISGPEVQLSSQQVQNFALALHELATNAVKYGALKRETGRLSVTWERMRYEAGTKRLVLSWIESGVDVPPENLSRRGYGRELIERALTYALQARTEFELAGVGWAAGSRWRSPNLLQCA